MSSLLAAKGIGAVPIINRFLPQIDLWTANFTPSPDIPYLQALSTYISRGINSGWYQTCPGIFPLECPILDGTKVSLGDTTHRLVFHGDGYIHSPYFGIQGDGESFYADTNVNVDSWADINNHAIGVFSQSCIPDLGTCCAPDGDTRMGFQMYNNNARLVVYPCSTTGVNTNIKPSQGMSGYSRTDSGNGFFGGAGNPKAFIAGTSPLPTVPLRLWKFTSAISGNEFAGFIYGKMTQAQWIDHQNAKLELQLALNGLRDFPPPEEVGDNYFSVTLAEMSPPETTTRSVTQTRRPVDDDETNDTFGTGPITETNQNWIKDTLTSTDSRIGVWARNRINFQQVDGRIPNGAPDSITLKVGNSSFTCAVKCSDVWKSIIMTWVQTAYRLKFAARNDTDCTVLAPGYTKDDGFGWIDIAALAFDTSDWDLITDPSFLYEDVNIATGVMGHNAYFTANAASIFTETYLGRLCATNLLILPIALCDAATEETIFLGTWYDDEPHDFRTPAERLLCTQGIDAIHGAKGFKYVLSGNAKREGDSSGWSKSIGADILSLPNLDYVPIVIPRIADNDADAQQQIQDQLTIFKGPDGLTPVRGDKLAMTLIPGPDGIETPLSYVQYGRQVMLDNEITIVYQSGGGTPGGALSRTRNQNYATILGLPTS